ncbi:MAG: glycosyltransferase family 4 protein [Candidatus Absconditabacteria bacterium]
MKVLEVISSLQPTGGAETFAVNFSIEMSKKTDLTVVVLHDNNNNYFIDSLRNSNVKLIILRKKRKFDLPTILTLFRIIKRNRFDVIHTENNALITSFLAVLPLLKKPNIHHTLHLEPFLETPTRLLQYLYRFIFHFGFVYPICLSDKLAQKNNDFYDIDKSAYINNGISLSKFSSKLEICERPFDICVVARFEIVKNHFFMIDLIKELKTLLPKVNVVFVGHGSMYEKVKKYVEQSDLVTTICFTGLVNNTQFYYENSKIFLLCSTSEANPISLIEAMASGNIIVASRVGGIPDFVLNEVNGYLCDLDNFDGFLQTIYKILKNPTDFQFISEHNVKDAQKYSIENTCDNYLDHFIKNIHH